MKNEIVEQEKQQVWKMVKFLRCLKQCQLEARSLLCNLMFSIKIIATSICV
jgi:hypothetical protein